MKDLSIEFALAGMRIIEFGVRDLQDGLLINGQLIQEILKLEYRDDRHSAAEFGLVRDER